jgi:pyroglutamyl-peptidase
LTLVTGFGPFAQIADNPSARLASAVAPDHVILEVSYRAADEFISKLQPGDFDRLLMLGVAAGRRQMAFELFARNQRAGVDVRGEKGGGAEIDPGAPLLLASNLWSPELCGRLIARHGNSLYSSLDAGAYLCNYLAYLALRKFPDKAVGFLHVVMPDALSIKTQQAVLEDVLAG